MPPAGPAQGACPGAAPRGCRRLRRGCGAAPRCQRRDGCRGAGVEEEEEEGGGEQAGGRGLVPARRPPVPAARRGWVCGALRPGGYRSRRGVQRGRRRRPPAVVRSPGAVRMPIGARCGSAVPGASEAASPGPGCGGGELGTGSSQPLPEERIKPQLSIGSGGQTAHTSLPARPPARPPGSPPASPRRRPHTLRWALAAPGLCAAPPARRAPRPPPNPPAVPPRGSARPGSPGRAPAGPPYAVPPLGPEDLSSKSL